MKKAVLMLLVILFLLGVLQVAGFPAQQETQAQADEDNAYGSKFFEQLRTIFGRFRDADLQRVFQDAQPIQCSELVGRKGEWRPVAFINEDRRLGDWCRESLEEVKSDLAVYTFKGTCSGNQGTVQVGSEFPTTESIEEYREGRIDLKQVDITVNDPVTAVMDARTMAYKFDLPYLFLTSSRPSRVYSFNAPDRNAAYASEVASRWECKAVSSKDVTYRFLICRVNTVPQGRLRRNEKWEPTFGSSAYFVLSDGTEAKSSVNMTFGNETPAEEKPSEPAPSQPARPVLKRK